jgi:ATP-dependent Clp protease ATP-binding subunit ClpA
MSDATDQPSEAMNNFTPRAQLVLANARREAERLNHNFVGTEHLLLGLISLGQGVAVNVLQKLGLNLEQTREEVKKQIGQGPEQKIIGNIPYTPRVKRVLALAAKEAKALSHTYVGTEHILLGLLHEGDGVAARVLESFKVDIAQTRQEILKELDPNFGMHETKPIEVTAGADVAFSPNPSQQSSGSKDHIDTNKRYDVYCAERGQEVVYRNARFKGRKALLPRTQQDFASEFIELEQADGQTIFIARASVIKFCEHTSKAEGQT